VEGIVFSLEWKKDSAIILLRIALDGFELAVVRGVA
jgi:hypothetical protein